MSLAAPPAALLFVHPVRHLGQRQLGSRWSEFIGLLRGTLRQAGGEDRGTGAELLIFSFPHPSSAIGKLQETLTRIKKETAWQPAHGSLPLQLVLHLADPEAGHPVESPLSPDLWRLLRPESLYLTTALRTQWEQLMADHELSSHVLAPAEQGLFLLTFKDQSLGRSERLLPNRALPLLGTHQECFYCGMTLHEPAFCPSKLLPNQQQGLSLAGYLPFDKLDHLYKNAILHPQPLIERLAAGVKTSQLRQDEALQVFLAYFDLNRVYQLRFLHQIAFSFFSSWAPRRRDEKIRITNRNLHLGLDCLRVGQYRQAEQIFSEESLRQQGNPFCALVGLAYCALEQRRGREALTQLEKAVGLAGVEKERIYIGLLLSRLHDLQGERWKAERAVDSVLSLDRACLEGRYRKCQLLARNDTGEQVQEQLKALASDSREMYLTLLLDPMLVPLETMVEDLLVTQFRVSRQAAGKSLERAEAEGAELRTWFKEEEQNGDLVALLGDLATLRSQHARGSYYDVLEVAARAEDLYYQGHRLREARIDQFKERFLGVTGRWESYHQHWEGYAYQSLFQRFGVTLENARRNLEKARELSKLIQGEAYLSAWEKVEEAETELNEIKPLLTRMSWVDLALDGFKVFARKLVLLELLLIAGGLVAFFLFYSTLSGSSGALSILAQPWFLKQAVSVVTLLFAPLLALALALWEINGR